MWDIVKVTVVLVLGLSVLCISFYRWRRQRISRSNRNAGYLMGGALLTLALAFVLPGLVGEVLQLVAITIGAVGAYQEWRHTGASSQL